MCIQEFLVMYPHYFSWYTFVWAYYILSSVFVSAMKSMSVLCCYISYCSDGQCNVYCESHFAYVILALSVVQCPSDRHFNIKCCSILVFVHCIHSLES